jgi:uncharacterized protein (DUF362 family)
MLKLTRRGLLSSSLLTGAAACSAGTPKRLGIPGPFPGRVVEIAHAGSIVAGRYDREAVRDMMRRGMVELTGAPSWQEAWQLFFQPGDVVGVKLNPVGRPAVISAPEVFLEIVEGLQAAGVKPHDIVAYDRYKAEFLSAGFDKWLPAGVRWSFGTDKPHPFQLDMEGYEESQYVELPLLMAKADLNDRHYRRSYLAKFITRDVNKMVNLCVLKHHQSAGITLALKNMSHGLVNNVFRSHNDPSNNSCGSFIPAIVDHPIIREKVVLNITDAIKAAYHGGPLPSCAKYAWEHKRMYFSTDPVAMDRIGLGVLDAQRVKMGRQPIALAAMDEDSRFVRMQPEHIDIAGLLGLGEADLKKIQLKQFKLA